MKRALAIWHVYIYGVYTMLWLALVHASLALWMMWLDYTILALISFAIAIGDIVMHVKFDVSKQRRADLRKAERGGY